MGCGVSKKEAVIVERSLRELQSSPDQAQLNVLVGRNVRNLPQQKADAAEEDSGGSCTKVLSPRRCGNEESSGQVAKVNGESANRVEGPLTRQIESEKLAAAVRAVLGRRALVDDGNETRAGKSNVDEEQNDSVPSCCKLPSNQHYLDVQEKILKQAGDASSTMDSDSDIGSMDSELAKIILSCCQDFDSLEL